jgi:hypothetical protein
MIGLGRVSVPWQAGSSGVLRAVIDGISPVYLLARLNYPDGLERNSRPPRKGNLDRMEKDCLTSAHGEKNE